MKLSTKGRYAVTAMLDLALNDGKNPVTLAQISQCQGISLSYLEQLFARLRKASLVTGVRGPGGGYRLAREAVSITVADIIDAVDEHLDATRCEGREDCQDGEKCLSHELWCELSKQIHTFLSQINLADFLTRPNVMTIIEQQSGKESTPPPTLGARPEAA